MHAPAPLIRFDRFELDRANRQLRRDGVEIDIGSRYFDALVLLVDRHGELVTKDAFMQGVWRGIPVTDEALTQCIRTLRKALDDDAADPRFIATVPKHGYRFIAALDPPAIGEAAPASIAPSTDAAPSRIAGAATLAGALAGALAGLACGMLASTGGAGSVLMLAAFVGALGLLAGAAIGMAIAATIAWRGQADGWIVGAAMAGGFAAGACGNLLGREGVGLLAGKAPEAVTGPLEGLVLGLVVGLAAQLVFVSRNGWASVLTFTALTGALGGLVLHNLGGTLLGGSLASLHEALPAMQLDLQRVAQLAGERTFDATMRGMTATVEAIVFTMAMALGLLAARRTG